MLRDLAIVLVGVLVLAGVGEAGVSIGTYSTDLVIKGADSYFSQPGGASTEINTAIYQDPDSSGIITERNTSPDGGSTMPWTVEEVTVADGKIYFFNVTNPSLVAGQYLVLDVELTGNLIASDHLNRAISVYASMRDSVSGAIVLRANVQSTLQFTSFNQWNVGSFLLIPPSEDITGMSFTISYNFDPSPGGSPSIDTITLTDTTSLLPASAYMRLSSFVLDYDSIEPAQSSQCFFGLKGPLRVFANDVDSPVTIDSGTGFFYTDRCENGDVYSITRRQLSDSRGGSEVLFRNDFTIEALVDDPGQFLLIESSVYGWQTDTTANYVAHYVKATIKKSGEPDTELDGTVSIEQFEEDEVRSTRSMLMVPADAISSTGDQIVLELYSYTVSGSSFITLQQDNTEKNQPSSGWSINIKSFPVSVS